MIAGDRAAGQDPLPVSVVIPAYNRAELVQRAIASAFGQRPRPPAEVIVVDDASSDATADRAEAMGARVIRHDVNRGEARARNTGIAAARHEWIALLDSDDEWLPGHLAQLWPEREGHVLVADAMLGCGADPRRDRLHGLPADRPAVLRSPRALVFPQNFVNPSATLFRRDVGLRVGGYEPHPCGTDLHFLLRLLEQGTGFVTPAVGAIYHLHDGQMTADARAFEDRLRPVVAGFSGRSWWSDAAFERLGVVHAWDDLRRAQREGDLRRAAARASWLGRPRRFRALVAMWRWRLRSRRRSGLVDRRGAPTVAVLPSGSADRHAATLLRARGVGSVVDLGAQTTLAATAAALARRPTAMGAAESRSHAALLRVLGIPRVHLPAGDSEA